MTPPPFTQLLRITAWAALYWISAGAAHAQGALIEPHQRLAGAAQAGEVALTLDACSGAYDAALIDFLIAQRIPATLFVTRRWLSHNPVGLTTLKAHPDLFQIENHGARHIPAVLGAGRTVFGIAGVGDLAGLRAEVEGGAQAITAATGTAPRWYRGATARYDKESMQEIQRLGFHIGGFSVNADQGASLPRAAVIKRVQQAKPGDVILAHMNHPASQTAEALQAALPQLRARGLKFVKLGGAPLVPTP